MNTLTLDNFSQAEIYFIESLVVSILFSYDCLYFRLLTNTRDFGFMKFDKHLNLGKITKLSIKILKIVA